MRSREGRDAPHRAASCGNVDNFGLVATNEDEDVALEKQNAIWHRGLDCSGILPLRDGENLKWIFGHCRDAIVFPSNP